MYINFRNRTNIFLLCLSCLIFHFNSTSQDTLPTLKEKVLKVNVYTDSGYITGSVYNVTDTTVTISGDLLQYNSMSINGGRLKTFNYYNINNVTRARKSSVLIGLMTGAATGALVGLITYSKPAPSQGLQLHILDDPAIPATIFGILGGLTGTIVGALIHKQTFHINKDRNKFQKFKLDMLSRLIEKKYY
jgi:hypothetical protein